MLKKLQSLLFEDEEEEEYEDEEEEEEIEVIEAKPEKRKKVEKLSQPKREKPRPEPNLSREREPEPQPQPQPSTPVLKRVEVTQAIPAQRPEEPVQQPAQAPAFNNANTTVFNRNSSIQHASPRPIQQEPARPAPVFSTPAPQPQSSFGISADEEAPYQEPARPNYNERRAAPAATKNTRSASVYEFRPVISPMFGVDEKDINAMQYLATPAPADPADAVHVQSQVISPMTGAVESTPAEPAAPAIVKEEPIPSFDGSAYTPKPQPREESPFPEFSLDDILSARDEEFTRQNVFANNDYRTPDIDETAVIDSGRYSPYDQQTLDFDRNN